MSLLDAWAFIMTFLRLLASTLAGIVGLVLALIELIEGRLGAAVVAFLFSVVAFVILQPNEQDLQRLKDYRPPTSE